MKENWNKKSDLEKKEWAEKCRKAQTKESLENIREQISRSIIRNTLLNFQKYKRKLMREGREMAPSLLL